LSTLQILELFPASNSRPCTMATTNGSNGETAPVSNEKVNTDIMTLTRFLTEEQVKYREASGDFT